MRVRRGATALLAGAALFAGVGQLAPSPALASASARTQLRLSATAERIAGGAAVVVHLAINCPPGRTPFNVLRLDQATTTKHVQHNWAEFSYTCDGSWHSVAAAVPVPEENSNADGTDYNLAPAGWRVGPALLRYLDSSYFDATVLAAKTVDVRKGPATPPVAPGVTLPSRVARVAKGAAVIAAPQVTCPAGENRYLPAQLAQVLSPTYAQPDTVFVNFTCTGTVQSVRIPFPTYLRPWRAGPAFLQVGGICAGDPCPPAWRSVTVG